jgi:hypothetical protein
VPRMLSIRLSPQKNCAMSRRDSPTDRSDCRGSIGFKGRAGRCTSIADHYRPAVPKRKARSRISLIMCTGGEHHGVRHDQHFSAASSFQISVSRGLRTCSSGMLASVSQRRHLTCNQP